jgi:hypothetical protein
MTTNDTGEYLRILADDSHPCDKHCCTPGCGRVLLNPYSLVCEICDPESLPCFLREQAA